MEDTYLDKRIEEIIKDTLKVSDKQALNYAVERLKALVIEEKKVSFKAAIDNVLKGGS